MNQLEKHELVKQAILIPAGVGAISGALQAPEERRGEGALRGTGVGLGVGDGVEFGQPCRRCGWKSVGRQVYGGQYSSKQGFGGNFK